MKKYYILAVVNKATNVGEILYTYRQWLIKEFKNGGQDVDVEIEYLNTDLPLSYKVVVPKNPRYGIDLLGLDDIKGQLRKIIRPNQYHLVLFFYKPTPEIKGLVNLTYPNPINKSEVYIELCCPNGANFDVVRHEGLHALHALARFNGIYITNDDLDLFGNDEEAKQYRKRFYGKIDGIDGDEENLKRLRVWYSKILTEPIGRATLSLLISALTKLASLYTALIEKKKAQTENGKKILNTALAVCGQSLGNGYIGLGCAEEVNAVVKKALGKPIGGDISTARMRVALQDTSRFLRVSADNIIGGEIVMSASGMGDNSDMPNGHVGIYVGNGKIMSNDSATGLFLQNFTLQEWDDYYVKRGGYPMEFYRVL